VMSLSPAGVAAVAGCAVTLDIERVDMVNLGGGD